MEAIKLVCFDLDDTLLSHSTWTNLGLALGISREKDQEMLAAYMTGELSYSAWNDAVLALYREHTDATREGITRALSKYIFNDGAREAVAYLQEKGYIIALISGSIDIAVAMVATDLGITFFKANSIFIFDAADRLVGIETDGDDVAAKPRHLKAFCDTLGIGMHECACVGDGFNDIELFRQTKHGVTFADSKIKEDAWKVIETLHDIKKIF